MILLTMPYRYRQQQNFELNTYRLDGRLGLAQPT